MSGLTKILIVLQLVFSLVVSVLLVLMVSKLEPYKSRVDQADAGRLAAQAMYAAKVTELQASEAALTKAREDLTAALAQATRDRTTLQGRIIELTNSGQAAEVKNAQAVNQINSLTNAIATQTAQLAEKDKVIADLTPRISDLTRQYNETYRINNELQNQLRGAELTIRKLQEQIATSATTGAATGASAAATDSTGQVTNLSASNAQAGRPINAKVDEVRTISGRTVMQLPLGSRDGVRNGNRFFIYRGNTYIGEAVITQVSPSQALATVEGSTQSPVQAGDMVMSAQ